MIGVVLREDEVLSQFMSDEGRALRHNYNHLRFRYLYTE